MRSFPAKLLPALAAAILSVFTLAAAAGILSCAPASHATPGLAARPNPQLTPGEIFENATVELVCAHGYARRMRHVLPEQYVQVFAAYRIDFPQPVGQYELDHLIPLELGGDNSNRNLWPQPAAPRPGFNQKDQLENLLHDRVCSGAMTLAEAQREIAIDWLAMYSKYVGPGT